MQESLKPTVMQVNDSMQYELKSDIQGILDKINSDGLKYEWSDTEWTKQIKSRLCDRGKNKGYFVYASSADGKDGGEWLYDLTWLNYSEDGLLINVELALESEWSIKGIDDDFQKLLLCRAEMRMLVFQAKSISEAKEKISNLKRQIARFTKSLKGDIYLFSCWNIEIQTFIHERYVY